MPTTKEFIEKDTDKEQDMNIQPEYERAYDLQTRKLLDKVAIITGGDSGIGRAVAVHFARHGADVVICYHQNDEDAETTKKLVEEKGRKALLFAGDIGDEAVCREIVEKTLAVFGKIDILVNNAAEQHPKDDISEISAEQLTKTFTTNIFSMFYLTKACMPHFKPGCNIINTTSVTAYKGNPKLIDYSSTKGAIVSFTRALAASLADKGIRVNGVAPGPIWTPLIPSTFDAEHVKNFGQDTPMGRAGQPAEVAPAFVFLASEDASYISGQVIHPNGGYVLNG